MMNKTTSFRSGTLRRTSMLFWGRIWRSRPAGQEQYIWARDGAGGGVRARHLDQIV